MSPSPSPTLKYVVLASTTLLYYDYLLTLPLELKRIWGQPISLVSILYVVNRYSALVGYIPVLMFTFDPPFNDTVRQHTLCTRSPLIGSDVLSGVSSMRSNCRLHGLTSTTPQVVSATLIILDS